MQQYEQADLHDVKTALDTGEDMFFRDYDEHGLTAMAATYDGGTCGTYIERDTVEEGTSQYTLYAITTPDHEAVQELTDRLDRLQAIDERLAAYTRKTADRLPDTLADRIPDRFKEELPAPAAHPTDFDYIIQVADGELPGFLDRAHTPTAGVDAINAILGVDACGDDAETVYEANGARFDASVGVNRFRKHVELRPLIAERDTGLYLVNEGQEYRLPDPIDHFRDAA